MSEYNRFVAGENICIEKKDRETVIHCTAVMSPQKNLNSGFFRIKNVPAEDKLQRLVISNCVFKLNGRYRKIEDYVITDFPCKYTMVYLNLAYCRFDCEIYDDEEKLNEYMNEHLEDSHLVLLYKLTYNHYRISIESFAAGGLIDTVYGGEGFMYQLLDGSIKTTFTRTVWGDQNEFDISTPNVMYIPCFNPATGEGINIHIPNNSGGVVFIGKNDTCYEWSVTGYPTWDSIEPITVNVNKYRVYF